MCEISNLQEVQLLYRGRAMLCVVAKFVKSLKVMPNYTVE